MKKIKVLSGALVLDASTLWDVDDDSFIICQIPERYGQIFHLPPSSVKLDEEKFFRIVNLEGTNYFSMFDGKWVKVVDKLSGGTKTRDVVDLIETLKIARIENKDARLEQVL